MDFVFGYGSLSSEVRDAPLAVAVLRGFARTWNVAMDNLAAVPGYKYYLDPLTGERPAVFVTFLNVVPVVGAGCVGFLLPVRSASELVALDRRERNYERVDVSSSVVLPGDSRPGLLGPVWTYVGRRDACSRYAGAAARGVAVIQAAYLTGVEEAFAARGLLDEFSASTRPPECPVRELLRVNDSSRT